MTTGIIEQQLKVFTRESDKCLVNNIIPISNEFKQLIIDDYIGVFAVLISGVTLSLIILLIEFCINCFI